MLCLMDVWCDLELRDDAPQWMKDMRSDGSFALRHAIEQVSPAVSTLWDSMGDDYHAVTTFDFEFCPIVVSYAIDWTPDGNECVKLRHDAKNLILAHTALFQRCGLKL